MSLPSDDASEEPMARRKPSVLVTYDDYVTFPDDKRYEVLDGEAFVVPSPNRRHQQIVGRLHVSIANHLRRYGGGEVFIAPFDVVLTTTDIVQPDIVYIADADAGVLTDANVWGTPTWVVEVLSPSTASRDRTLKLQAYARSGVPEVWIVDPVEDTVQKLVLRASEYDEVTLARAPDGVSPDALPDLAVDLAELLER